MQIRGAKTWGNDAHEAGLVADYRHNAPTACVTRRRNVLPHQLISAWRVGRASMRDTIDAVSQLSVVRHDEPAMSRPHRAMRVLTLQ